MKMPSKKPSGEAGKKAKVSFSVGGKKISAELRSSGKAKKDYKNFLESGYKAADAGQQSKESKKGITEAVKWLQEVDSALVVMDSKKNSKTPANIRLKSNQRREKTSE